MNKKQINNNLYQINNNSIYSFTNLQYINRTKVLIVLKPKRLLVLIKQLKVLAVIKQLIVLAVKRTSH